VATQDHKQPASPPQALRVTIDGNVFDIAAVAEHPGEYHYTWISGPNPGYGFTSASSTGKRLEMLDHVNAVRNFLTQIDPKTGYIEEVS
jgi:hypothetical protein